MTVTTEMQQAPRVVDDYDALMQHKTVIDANLTLLEMNLERLTRQKEQLMRHRTLLLQRAEKFVIPKSPVGRMPMESIAPFMTATDVCNLSQVSRIFHQKCRSEFGKTLVSHVFTPNNREMTIHEAIAFVEQLCLPMIETLSIDAKRPCGKVLMEAFSLKGGICLPSLKSLRISAAAQTGSFLKNLFVFVSTLKPNQLSAIHLSGFLSIRHVSSIFGSQAESLEKFQVDYFVNGHENELVPEFLPAMPKLQSLIYDVADVTEIHVDLLIDRLSQVDNPQKVETIYLPHVQIVGDSSRILYLIELLKGFVNIGQLVVRFRHLPLSVREIVGFRESFSSLPACCISDHFVVIQRSWCSWWPSLPEVWDRADKITGLSVFREQIDFESLGTSATREWLKLSAEQKALWSSKIAPQVLDLYLKTPKRNCGSSSIRAVSV
jgi:hypothetical protein